MRREGHTDSGVLSSVCLCLTCLCLNVCDLGTSIYSHCTLSFVAVTQKESKCKIKFI